MGLQIIIVALCLILALGFMARKVVRTLRNRGGCDCDNCKSKTRACTGGASCPGQVSFQELRPFENDSRRGDRG